MMRLLVLECDDFEDCDVTSTTSRDVFDDVTNRRAVDTFLYRVSIVYAALNHLISKIFSVRVAVADKQTQRYVD